MTKLTRVANLLLLLCPSSCFSSVEPIDLELRLSSTIIRPNPSPNQESSSIIDPNSSLNRDVSSVPHLVTTYTNLPSQGTRIPTPDSKNNYIAGLFFKSPIGAPNYQETREGNNKYLHHVSQCSGGILLNNPSVDRSSFAQRLPSLENHSHYITAKSKGRFRYEPYNKAATSSKRPIITGPTMDNEERLIRGDASLQFYRPINEVDKWKSFWLHNANMPSGKNYIISQSPHRSMIPEESPIQLIFDRNIFSNEGKTIVGELKIKYLTSLIEEHSPNESLLLDEGDPLQVASFFKESSSCRPFRGAHGEKLNYQKVARERWQFKTEAVKTMWEQKELWLNYWDKNFGINHEYQNLQPHGEFSLIDVQKNFLVGMFYLNMITSIVVDYKKFAQSTWRERHIENRKIMMKGFAQSFQEISKNVAQNKLKDCGLNSWSSSKRYKTKFIWLHMRNWLQESGRYKIVYEWIENSAYPHIELFDDVFVYSISNLNILLSQYYK